MDILEGRWRPVAFLAAIIAPPALAAVMLAMRDFLPNTSAALILVLVTLMVAGIGVRSAGYLAALSSGVWFDFFLTVPYLGLTIDDPLDVQTAILVVLVGIAVTELALWGRRQQAAASRNEGYLSGVLDATDPTVPGRGTPADEIERVEKQLITILDLDACKFAPRLDPALPTLGRAGGLSRAGKEIDVRHGLPTDTEIALPVRAGGKLCGSFLLTASAHVARPTLEQRRVAGALADRVGVALTSHPAEP